MLVPHHWRKDRSCHGQNQVSLISHTADMDLLYLIGASLVKWSFILWLYAQSGWKYCSYQIKTNWNKTKMLKIFISKICKYKQGQKYENINIFFPFAKTFEMLRHAAPDFSKGKSCANRVLKKGPMKRKNGLCVPGCVLWIFCPKESLLHIFRLKSLSLPVKCQVFFFMAYPAFTGAIVTSCPVQCEWWFQGDPASPFHHHQHHYHHHMGFRNVLLLEEHERSHVTDANFCP